ncbi:protein ANTAGONIST OF LIKE HETEROCHROMATIN PROTEIN 1-like [Trichogramma pretiosum]|uniref:protein ANTAGONIST OF LIKE HETEROCHROMATIN PROTEIN 1-like n=1 Tax=Trichogramma pretiosum TaxID=7493 RepID=UPI000C718BFD|nr:protein ANTAGONIST OF LIKE HETEROCHROMATIN PROTEIN 1-like [Trichogramma pretiosum]
MNCQDVINLYQIWNVYQEVVAANEENNRNRVRRWWAKPHIRHNYLQGYGGYRSVFLYFKLNDEEEFYRFTNLTIHQFNFVFEILKPFLVKRSRRPPLPAQLRFAAVLNYLAKGDSQLKNAWFTSIGESTMYAIVPEVCKIISQQLVPRYVRQPSSADFKRVAEEFEQVLHFPHCIGTIDGRHCPIRQPKHSGSAYYNYKKFFSLNMMAICDVHQRFLMFNLGGYGSFNDAFTFNNSDICEMLQDNQAIPIPELLPNSNIMAPYYLIGDGGFPNEYFQLPIESYQAKN